MPFVPVDPSIDLAAQAKDATLLLPAVATGSVPQLSIDLFLSTLPHTLLGTFHTQHVLPCVGCNAFDAPPANPKRSKKAAAEPTPTASALVTSVQVFSVPSLRAIVIQQRAPVIVGRAALFVEELLVFARTLVGLAQVVLLTSSHAFRQMEENLDAVHPISFYLREANTATAPPASSASAQAPPSRLTQLLGVDLRLNSLHFNPLAADEAPLRLDQLGGAEEENDPLAVAAPKRNSTAVGSSGPTPDQEDDSNALVFVPRPIAVPGGGITRALYEAVTTCAEPFATIFLHAYINEGATNYDARAMTHHVYIVLHQLAPMSAREQLTPPCDMAWREPPSWHALFGNEPEQSLYL